MKKILFVDMHRFGRSPSQRFRYEQYLTLLQQKGFIISHSYLLNRRDDQIFYSEGHYIRKGLILSQSVAQRLVDFVRSFSYDYVFIQREAFMLGTAFFERLFSKSNATLIFDFDDSIWLNQISSHSPNRNLNFLKNPSKTSTIIKLADTVVAGNKYLASYAKKFNSNVRIIPTTIDTDLYQPHFKSFKKEKITIGWSGSKTTIDHFKLSLPVLEIITEKYRDRIDVKVIGDREFQNKKLKIAGQAWNLETEVNDLHNFDIGIMPLPNDEWAKGKCGLKGLQYMALGIPTIMSPVGVNSEIIKSGENGFLAESVDEWVNALDELISNEGLRHELGEKGRETVLRSYSVISQSDNFLSLFE